MRQACAGGSRYSVMAKMTYTVRTRTPMNHADFPLFVEGGAEGGAG